MSLRPGISTKLVTFLAVSALAIVAAVGAMRYHVGRTMIEDEVDQQLAAITRRLAISLNQSAYDEDGATIDDTIEAEFFAADVAAILVWNVDGEWLAGRQRSDNGPMTIATGPDAPGYISRRQALMHEAIFLEDGVEQMRVVPVGEVVVYVDRQGAEDRLLVTLTK